MPERRDWTREELIAAFTLYCQIPFGRIHHRNPEISALAAATGRTPSAVSLKLANFASLDPAILKSGRKGMGNASKRDKEIWDEFHANWNERVVEGEQLLQRLGGLPHELEDGAEESMRYGEGETREVTVQVRLQQEFFRRSILSMYGQRCCMSGIADERLLTASHIVPWSQDKQNRLNPRNGLCLSALHDRAFDRFLITVAADGVIHVSDSLKRGNAPSEIMRSSLLDLQGKRIAFPERFTPDASFLAWHNDQFDKLP